MTIPAGLYGNIYAVMRALQVLLVAADANFFIKLTSAHKVQIGVSSGTLTTITWTDPALGRLLGFRTSPSPAAATVDADDTPENTWVPTYYTFDSERFHIKQKDVFKGSRSVVGRLAGVRLTSEQYSRVLKWDAEPATNVFVEAAQDSYTLGSLTYPEAERCFEQFMVDARTAALTTQTSANLNPKGFYYIHDWSGWTGATDYPNDPDSGGVRFDLDSSADEYVFCSPDPMGVSLPSMLDNTAKNYYSVEVELTTATAPTWDKP